MNESARAPRIFARPRRRAARLMVLALTVASAVAIWLVATQLLGIEVRSPEMGDQPSERVTLTAVVAASTVASTAGWALLAALERLTNRAPRIWLAIAVGALILSLGAPLTGAGITTANKLVLAALHVVVAAVLIPGMLRTTVAARSAPRPREEVDDAQLGTNPDGSRAEGRPLGIRQHEAPRRVRA